MWAHAHAARKSAIAAEDNSGAVGDSRRVCGVTLVFGQRQVHANDVALLRRPTSRLGGAPRAESRRYAQQGSVIKCMDQQDRAQ